MSGCLSDLAGCSSFPSLTQGTVLGPGKLPGNLKPNRGEERTRGPEGMKRWPSSQWSTVGADHTGPPCHGKTGARVEGLAAGSPSVSYSRCILADGWCNGPGRDALGLFETAWH